MAHIHPAALQNFHATSLASNSAAAAMNAANAAAAIAAAEVAHKRPRLDLSHPPQGPVAGSSNAGPASNSISQPLRIDTRDQPKVRPQAFFIQKFFWGGILHYSAKIHFVFVKVVVKKSDKEMCNLFLDIILFAILLIFMVLLMILPDTTQTMYYVCSRHSIS